MTADKTCVDSLDQVGVDITMVVSAYKVVNATPRADHAQMRGFDMPEVVAHDQMFYLELLLEAMRDRGWSARKDQDYRDYLMMGVPEGAARKFHKDRNRRPEEDIDGLD